MKTTSRDRRVGRLARALIAAAVAVSAAVAVVGVSAAGAAAPHSVTFVNKTQDTVWVGSVASQDGSATLFGLPTLAAGQSATIAIPEDSGPGHWRGRFFARQGCSGEPGSTFHCAIGDCGPFPDHCTTGQQVVSLAEFNFDRDDAGAPWYNVSYVDAVSVPTTIDPVGPGAPGPEGDGCGPTGCGAPILDACPGHLAQYATGGYPALCTNPNRDSPTDYSAAIAARAPRAYTWSKHDTEPGNRVMHNCVACDGFVVTFHTN